MRKSKAAYIQSITCIISVTFKYVLTGHKERANTPTGKCAKEVNRQFRNETVVTVMKKCSTSLVTKGRQMKIRHLSSTYKICYKI